MLNKQIFINILKKKKPWHWKTINNKMALGCTKMTNELHTCKLVNEAWSTKYKCTNNCWIHLYKIIGLLRIQM